MTLANRYDARNVEPGLHAIWDAEGLHDFQLDGDGPIYAIDTPPPSVSGHLHLGHVFSYAHADFFARFRRMRGENVFYPMGFDDNGLPTERLVERIRGVRASEIGRSAFIRECLETGREAEREYEALWRRLGLSIDWRYTYRTIDEESRRIAQKAFLDLLRDGMTYRQRSPTIWCPECRTAIAQAELNDLDRETTFFTLAFELDNGRTLPIATTRPELLPACVAVFVHPDDTRYRDLLGHSALVPLYRRPVPILADPGADPTKGTGAVMCCTFGDSTDISWWRTHQLPLIEVIGRDGRMTESAAPYAGQTTDQARREITAALANGELLLDAQPLSQVVRVHERCDTPVEYLISQQWFIRVLDHRQAFLDAGERIAWWPAHMRTRYRQWVENLSWDWCISRQRYFGVPFPLWYCAVCGEPVTADETDLPVDPTTDQPGKACSCGSSTFAPETDVMDTWATSSLTPQIVGRWLRDSSLYRRVFPMTLRPQAHEIIRTWAFYTIVRSHYHTGQIPWTNVAISGWGLAPEGTAKLSKSRGGGPVGPMEMVERYSADAVRYWAAGTGLGRDAVISEERIQSGAKWVTKLWNIARFAERFLEGYSARAGAPVELSAADRWLLARVRQLITAVTAAFEQYDYAVARGEIETFFWRDLADNYLEMAKKRLYDGGEGFEAARFTLHYAVVTTLKLLAPLLPYVTDAIYRQMFAATDGAASVHRARWPAPDDRFDSSSALQVGDALREIATAVRRFKSERNLSLGAELAVLYVSTGDPSLAEALHAATPDLLSVTRARAISIETADNRPEGSELVRWIEA